MIKRIILSLLPIAVIIILPLSLRKKAEAIDVSADQLVIVSPHNEAIRYEFETAFRRFYHEKTGRKVCIDWRATGGTSDIVRYVNGTFTANFKEYWTKELKRPWSDEVARSFMNPKVSPADSPARKAFLDSSLGIGIDLFFGGGQYDFHKLATAGLLVPCGYRERHPEDLAGDNPPLVQAMGGEVWYDAQDRYYGACFSSFGLCANLDRLEKLGFDKNAPLASWTDLADTRLINAIGLVDPTKSGSINKCFEMLVQKQMQDTVASLQKQVDSGALSQRDALDRGWQDAMLLIKKIGGNSRYLTMSASQAPVDCASGQIAAGMCIDFYGRSQSEWERRHVGRPTMVYISPEAGSSVSADPIGLFRGAQNEERAKMFIDFVMSKEGQLLWNSAPGTPGGPLKYSINRLPVRRDLYTPEYRQFMTAPDAAPFELAKAFTYQGAWTGPYFDLLRNVIRVMVIDCEKELKESWKAIVQAGGPDKCPRAMEAFGAMPFRHSSAAESARRLGNTDDRTRLLREWGAFFRSQYRQARELAQEESRQP